MQPVMRLGAGIMLLTAPAFAEPVRAPVLVELFTSQGCSSCPPADEILSDLAERSDVIALSLHVDYWDYLGWKDSFGSPEYTARQRDYASVMNERTIYTPQMIVSGQVAVVGSQRELVEAAIRTLAQTDEEAKIVLTESDTGVAIDVQSVDPGWRGRATVSIAYLSDREVVEIVSGENAGRTATYRNVVTKWRELGEWSGGNARFSAPFSSTADYFVIIVQDDETGKIISCKRS